MGKPTYTVLDIETTGLDPHQTQIIEIGAILLDENLNVLDTFETFIQLNEGHDLPENIRQLTGITKEDLENGMIEKEALEALQAFIRDTILVAHNIQFELSFLKVRGNIEPKQFACTMLMAHHYGLFKVNLDATCKSLNISNPNHHRALNDAKVGMQIFVQLIDKLNGKEFLNRVLKFRKYPLSFTPEYVKEIVVA